MGLLWLLYRIDTLVKRAAPSLRSNIPQTALVAALDTYNLYRYVFKTMT
jgi:hypothetical protein